MSETIHHECGVAGLYWLDKPVGPPGKASRLIADGNVSPLIPSMLLDLQNRGQLAAGLTSYSPDRIRYLETYKDVGMVAEAFRLNQPDQAREILDGVAGRAAIGHTRYATCGQDGPRYVQPFERVHGRLWKWFSFAFNGNLANYRQLRDRLLAKRHYHFTLNTDTELILHGLSYRLRGEKKPDLPKVIRSLAREYDGAFNIVFLDAMGRLFAARDPMGFRPLAYAVEGNLFATASESVALSNLGFADIHHIEPGQMAIIENGRLRLEQYAEPKRKARCFFEWVYFANVGSEIDGAGVYTARARSGERMAAREDQPIDDNCIVVPVPDTAKAAADSFAYHLGLPSMEGLIRNRYVGRTFIQPSNTRKKSAKSKYTPLPMVLEGKRVFLIEDSIVRSTTLGGLAEQIRKRGRAKEIHVRVACPPIVAPCFYGIDMSTLDELFAPTFIRGRYIGVPSEEQLAKMAKALKIDSLRYLYVEDLAPCLEAADDSLCVGCVMGKYPTKGGNALFRAAKRNLGRASKGGRTYE